MSIHFLFYGKIASAAFLNSERNTYLLGVLQRENGTRYFFCRILSSSKSNTQMTQSTINTPIACLLSDTNQVAQNLIASNACLTSEVWNFADCHRHDWDATAIAEHIIAKTKDTLLNGGDAEAHADIMHIVRSYANLLLVAAGNPSDDYSFHYDEDTHLFETGTIANIDEILAFDRATAIANMEEVCHG